MKSSKRKYKVSNKAIKREVDAARERLSCRTKLAKAIADMMFRGDRKKLLKLCPRTMEDIEDRYWSHEGVIYHIEQLLKKWKA